MNIFLLCASLIIFLNSFLPSVVVGDELETVIRGYQSDKNEHNRKSLRNMRTLFNNYRKSNEDLRKKMQNDFIKKGNKFMTNMETYVKERTKQLKKGKLNRLMSTN
ncbi:hypothetical protein SNEBB_010297 [Seison nebaliae]|nr:hypothetical protein SNEBB_010297 [Seison nebaliae]